MYVDGSYHADVAVTLNNLAVLHKSQGNYSKADRAYRRALVIFKKAFGASHPQVTICKENHVRLLEHMQMGAAKNWLAKIDLLRRSRQPC